MPLRDYTTGKKNRIIAAGAGIGLIIAAAAGLNALQIEDPDGNNGWSFSAYGVPCVGEPADCGSADQVLVNQGGSGVSLAWEAQSGAGGSGEANDITGTGAATQLAYWTAQKTLSGADITYDDTNTVLEGGTFSGSLATNLEEGSLLFMNGTNGITEDNANLFWDDTNNRLGIGTTSPDEKLHLEGSGDINFKIESTSARANLRQYGVSGSQDGEVGQWLIFNSNDSIASLRAFRGTAADAGYLTFETQDTGGQLSERVRVGQDGKVGINDTSPDAQLDIVASSASTKGLIIQGAASQSANLTEWQNSAGTVLNVVDESGNVGIGTASPNEKLHVNGNLRLDPGDGTQAYNISYRTNGLSFQGQTPGTFSSFDLHSKDGDGTDIVGFFLWGKGTPGAITNRERLKMFWDPANSVYSIITDQNGTGILYPLTLYTQGNDNQLFLNTDGNVGIGTTTPTAKLDVAGTMSGQNLQIWNEDAVPTLYTTGGKVGIGTSSPKNVLTVSGTGASTTPLAVTDNSGNNRLEFNLLSNQAGELKINDKGGNTDILLSSSSVSYINGNNVQFGIGTTSPSTNLHLIGPDGQGTTPGFGGDTAFVLQNNGNLTSDQALMYLVAGTAGDAIIAFGDSDSGSRGQFRYLNASDDLAVYTAGSEQLRINSSGNLGIGTTSPSQLLDVNGGNLIVRTTADSANGQVLIDSDNSSGRISLYDLSGNKDINLTSRGIDSYINTGGQFGVGTSTPDADLDVEGTFRYSSTSGGGRSRLDLTDPGTTMFNMQESSDSGSTWDSVFVINYGGNTGIGTTTPTQALDVTGTVHASATLASSGTLVVEGNATVHGTLSGAVIHATKLTPRPMAAQITASGTALTVGSGKVMIPIGVDFAGYNLISVDACVGTPGITGSTEIKIVNTTDSTQMMSTAAQIETGEYCTYTSATRGTIDTATDDVTTGDILDIYIPSISTGTAPTGLTIYLRFANP